MFEDVDDGNPFMLPSELLPLETSPAQAWVPAPAFMPTTGALKVQERSMRPQSRVALLLLSVAAVAAGAYLFVRQRELREQRLQGHAASANSAEATLYSHKVLPVGRLFLTYDSTAKDSGLWLVRPPEMFRPYAVEQLVHWKDEGRVVWSRPGKTSADLLIEFAPETNHRVAVVRATCTDRNCSTTSQERGLPLNSRLFVNADLSVLLLSDTAFTIYVSIDDLMNNKGAAAARRREPGKSELAATSRDRTLILSSPDALTGELIEGKSHTRVRLAIDTGGSPAAIALSDGLQLVADTSAGTQLWDCPSSVLKGSADCTVYMAPPGFPRLLPATISDDECGIAISRGDSVWLVRRNAKTQELLHATGIVRCGAGETIVYMSRRIRYLTPARQSVTSETRHGVGEVP